MKKIPLWQQIVIGGILGIILGFINKKYAVDAKLLGDIFINMVKMTIIPLVFPLIVLGVAKMGNGKTIGRLSLKTIIYFEVVTTIILIMSVSLVNLFHIGVGVNLSGGDVSTLSKFADSKIEFSSFVLNAVPSNIFKAFAEQNMLAILFFGVFFGIGLGAIGKKGEPIINILEGLSSVMLKVLEYVIALSPIGVFGFLAFSVATYGWGKIASLLDLVVIIYAGLAIVAFVIFPIIAKIFKVPYWPLIGKIKDLLLIAASTRSSEANL